MVIDSSALLNYPTINGAINGNVDVHDFSLKILHGRLKNGFEQTKKNDFLNGRHYTDKNGDVKVAKYNGYIQNGNGVEGPFSHLNNKQQNHNSINHKTIIEVDVKKSVPNLSISPNSMQMKFQQILQDVYHKNSADAVISENELTAPLNNIVKKHNINRVPMPFTNSKEEHSKEESMDDNSPILLPKNLSSFSPTIFSNFNSNSKDTVQKTNGSPIDYKLINGHHHVTSTSPIKQQLDEMGIGLKSVNGMKIGHNITQTSQSHINLPSLFSPKMGESNISISSLKDFHYNMRTPSPKQSSDLTGNHISVNNKNNFLLSQHKSTAYKSVKGENGPDVRNTAKINPTVANSWKPKFHISSKLQERIMEANKGLQQEPENQTTLKMDTLKKLPPNTASNEPNKINITGTRLNSSVSLSKFLLDNKINSNKIVLPSNNFNSKSHESKICINPNDKENTTVNNAQQLLQDNLVKKLSSLDTKNVHDFNDIAPLQNDNKNTKVDCIENLFKNGPTQKATDKKGLNCYKSRLDNRYFKSNNFLTQSSITDLDEMNLQYSPNHHNNQTSLISKPLELNAESEQHGDQGIEDTSCPSLSDCSMSPEISKPTSVIIRQASTAFELDENNVEKVDIHDIFNSSRALEGDTSSLITSITYQNPIYNVPSNYLITVSANNNTTEKSKINSTCNEQKDHYGKKAHTNVEANLGAISGKKLNSINEICSTFFQTQNSNHEIVSNNWPMNRAKPLKNNSDIDNKTGILTNHQHDSAPKKCIVSKKNLNAKLNKEVTFSEDFQIFDTFSMLEYDRRNEDINPFLAAAEYELEKRIEKMDIFNVDLVRNGEGLGINIIGLGVGSEFGLQKLGIFVKALTPNGPAALDGRIQPYDQIIEVDGQSLVGVTQEYAATLLTNTGRHVSFKMGREREDVVSISSNTIIEEPLGDEDVYCEKISGKPDSKDIKRRQSANLKNDIITFPRPKNVKRQESFKDIILRSSVVQKQPFEFENTMDLKSGEQVTNTTIKSSNGPCNNDFNTNTIGQINSSDELSRSNKTKKETLKNDCTVETDPNLDSQFDGMEETPTFMRCESPGMSIYYKAATNYNHNNNNNNNNTQDILSLNGGDQISLSDPKDHYKNQSGTTIEYNKTNEIYKQLTPDILERLDGLKLKSNRFTFASLNAKKLSCESANKTTNNNQSTSNNVKGNEMDNIPPKSNIVQFEHKFNTSISNIKEWSKESLKSLGSLSRKQGCELIQHMKHNVVPLNAILHKLSSNFSPNHDKNSEFIPQSCYYDNDTLTTKYESAKTLVSEYQNKHKTLLNDFNQQNKQYEDMIKSLENRVKDLEAFIKEIPPEYLKNQKNFGSISSHNKTFAISKSTQKWKSFQRSMESICSSENSINHRWFDLETSFSSMHKKRRFLLALNEKMIKIWRKKEFLMRKILQNDQQHITKIPGANNFTTTISCDDGLNKALDISSSSLFENSRNPTGMTKSFTGDFKIPISSPICNSHELDRQNQKPNGKLNDNETTLITPTNNKSQLKPNRFSTISTDCFEKIPAITSTLNDSINIKDKQNGCLASNDNSKSTDTISITNRVEKNIESETFRTKTCSDSDIDTKNLTGSSIDLENTENSEKDINISETTTQKNDAHTLCDNESSEDNLSDLYIPEIASFSDEVLKIFERQHEIQKTKGSNEIILDDLYNHKSLPDYNNNNIVIDDSVANVSVHSAHAKKPYEKTVKHRETTIVMKSKSPIQKPNAEYLASFWSPEKVFRKSQKIPAFV